MDFCETFLFNQFDSGEKNILVCDGFLLFPDM